MCTVHIHVNYIAQKSFLENKLNLNEIRREIKHLIFQLYVIDPLLTHYLIDGPFS